MRTKGGGESGKLTFNMYVGNVGKGGWEVDEGGHFATALFFISVLLEDYYSTSAFPDIFYYKEYFVS